VRCSKCYESVFKRRLDRLDGVQSLVPRQTDVNLSCTALSRHMSAVVK
jgi:hypothetical protein